MFVESIFGIALGLECAAKLTHAVGTAPNTGTLTVYVYGGLIVQTQVAVTEALPIADMATPSIANDSNAGKLAALDTAVLAAVAAFVGQDAAWIASTGLPNLTEAWVAALAAIVPDVAAAHLDPIEATLEVAGWTEA